MNERILLNQPKQTYHYVSANVYIYNNDFDLARKLLANMITKFQLQNEEKFLSSVFNLNNNTPCKLKFTCPNPNWLPDQTGTHIIKNDKAIIIYSIDPYSNDPIQDINNYKNTLDPDFKGHIIIYPCIVSKAEVFIFNGKKQKTQRQLYESYTKDTQIDFIINNIAEFCKTNNILFANNINVLYQLVQTQIQHLYTNNIHTLFESHIFSQFNFSQLTPEKMKNAIDSAKENYSNTRSYFFLPKFISDESLKSRIPCNFYNIKTRLECYSMLLKILQGEGGTDEKSFKYLLISALFNVDIRVKGEAEQLINDVIKSLKLEPIMVNLVKFKHFLIWNNKENSLRNIPYDVTSIMGKMFNLCPPLNQLSIASNPEQSSEQVFRK